MSPNSASCGRQASARPVPVGGAAPRSPAGPAPGAPGPSRGFSRARVSSAGRREEARAPAGAVFPPPAREAPPHPNRLSGARPADRRQRLAEAQLKSRLRLEGEESSRGGRGRGREAGSEEPATSPWAQHSGAGVTSGRGSPEGSGVDAETEIHVRWQAARLVVWTAIYSPSLKTFLGRLDSAWGPARGNRGPRAARPSAPSPPPGPFTRPRPGTRGRPLRGRRAGASRALYPRRAALAQGPARRRGL